MPPAESPREIGLLIKVFSARLIHMLSDIVLQLSSWIFLIIHQGKAYIGFQNPTSWAII
jgi:hypothetical protein